MPTKTIVNTAFNDAERMIYCRKRILHTLDEVDSEKYSDLLPEDIKSVSLQKDQVACQLTDTTLLIGRNLLINNFWQHRTRIPSFFEYKIWKDYVTNDSKGCVPVGAISYGYSNIAEALETNMGSKPTIAVDKDGVQKLYFVNEKQQTCTCVAWQQLDKHRELFEQEFAKYSSIKFVPMCKHLCWLNAMIKLQAMQFMAKNKDGKYNPHICVYQYDPLHRIIKYKITNDGVRANAQWLPVKGWKEKHVYDASGMPTGECWSTFEAALTGAQPYKLVPYSQSLSRTLNRTGSL